jgi:large subunit ribosomal protein L5
MADEKKPEKQPKGEKGEKGDKQPKGEKGPKPEKQHKGEKAAKGDKGADKAAAAEKKQEKPAEPERPAAPARLRMRYEQQVRPDLMKEFGFTNPMQAPKLEKVVVNMGLGEAINNGKIIDASVEQLGSITGQKPVVTKSRKSIANFKLRQGQSIGAMVTLRGDRMYEFFDRLVSIALPRVRDFKGVSPKAFDGKGNYTLGVREQIIFPEINYDKVEKIKGLNITVVTTARNDEEGRALLRHLGMPFRT